MTRTIRTFYLFIIFTLSVIWVYETFTTIYDGVKNTSYEISENFIEKETKNLMELFLEDSTEFLLFTSIFIALMPLFRFNIKESESDISNPPPELIIRIPVK